MIIDRQQIKVLLIDDDVQFVDRTYNTLSTLGYDVSVCFSSKQAQHLIIQQPFHIVLLDCLMPEMDGHSLALYIQKYFGSSIVVILMSAVFQKNVMVFPDLTNVSSIIKKPFLKYELEEEFKKAEEKIFSSEETFHISSLILSDSDPAEVNNDLKKVKSIREGDVLLLFFYLLHSNFKGTLQLYDHLQSVEISFFDKHVVDVHENNKNYTIEYFLKNNLLDKKESAGFSKSNDRDIVKTLVDSSLVSPHHFLICKIDQLISFLKNFSKKTSYQFSLLPLKYSSVKIHHSQIINVITELIENNHLSDTYLKWFINQIEGHNVVLNKEQEEVWRNQKWPILKIINQKIDHFNSCKTIYQFLNLFPSRKSEVYKAIFWLFLQNFIYIKEQQNYSLKKMYIRRYECLFNLFKDLSFDDVFRTLGCENPYNSDALKKVYHTYMRTNHVDKLSQYGDKLKEVLGQVNQFVTEVYNTISNKDKFEAYRKELHLKEAKYTVKVEEMKSKIFNIVRSCKYEKAIEILDDLENLPKLDKFSKQEIFLWRTIVEAEQSGLSFSKKKIQKINLKLEQIKDHQTLSSALYFYMLGVLALCELKKKEAYVYFDKSLKIDNTFYLSKIKKMSV